MVVGVALVLALLFPVAFPAVPVPEWPVPTAVSLAPPTPVSQPQPLVAGTAGTPTGGARATLPADMATAAATPDPFGMYQPTMTSSGLFVATATQVADRFPGGLPSRMPRETREPTAYVPGAYPGIAVTATYPAAATSPTGPTASPTASATPGTGTPGPTTGTATATSTPTNTGYP